LFANAQSARWDIGGPSNVGEALYKVKSRSMVSILRSMGDRILDQRYNTVRRGETKVAGNAMEGGFKV
jgi:signal peptidase I